MFNNRGRASELRDNPCPDRLLSCTGRQAKLSMMFVSKMEALGISAKRVFAGLLADWAAYVILGVIQKNLSELRRCCTSANHIDHKSRRDKPEIISALPCCPIMELEIRSFLNDVSQPVRNKGVKWDLDPSARLSHRYP